MELSSSVKTLKIVYFLVCKIKVQVNLDFSFYCIFRKCPNFYGNGICDI